MSALNVFYIKDMRMTQKDIQKNNDASQYSAVALDTNLSVNPFGQNRVAEIAYTKTERLVIATHLVTNLVPKSESLRENVREKSQTLLPLVMRAREGVRSTDTECTRAIEAQVRHILSLLDVLHASGNISTMNLEVLKGAYADLVRFVHKSEDGDHAERVELDDTYFRATVSETSQPSHGQKSIGQSKGHKKEVTDTITDKKEEMKTDSVVSDTQQKNTKRARSLRTKRRTASRRMAVLDVVTKQGPVHIKDIAREVSDCSEKTIQRELASLITDGVVQKEGEKRWTTYALVV